MPDAQIPPGGVELRVVVDVAEDGSTQAVQLVGSTQTQAFEKVLKSGLLALRLQGSDAIGAEHYCLLARYSEGAQAAQLQWLPGRPRNAAQCAALPATQARDIALR